MPTQVNTPIMSHTTSWDLAYGPPASNPRREGDDGSWLCTDEPYLSKIKESCNLQPALRLPDPRNYAVPLCNRSARATLFNFPEDGAPRRSDFTGVDGPEKLALHFQANRSGRNVYLLEGLNPAYIAVFGDALRIDPRFFADHDRNSADLSLPFEPSIITRLPSLLNQDQSIMMGYHELRNPDRRFESFNVSCAESGRDMWTSRLAQGWEYPIILHQKCSAWTTVFQGQDAKGWSVLILCDPPIRNAHLWSKQASSKWEYDMIKMKTTPFQGGYADFVPRSFPLHADNQSQGPPRDGLHDDLCYYLATAHSTLPEGVKLPQHATVFMKKIIASHYLQLISYHQANLATMEYPLQRIIGLGQLKITQLQQQWSDIQLMCARCAHYLKTASSIMTQLGIPLEYPSRGSTSDTTWTESKLDFQYIHHELNRLVERALFFNESLTGLTGIVGNEQALAETRRSIREAKAVKALTLVGMVFIPLAFTTGLFSMSDEYLPGMEKFWTFFAVSVPLVLLVFIGTSLFDIGYDASGSWHIDIFRKRLYELPSSL
ncbi:unnamed protein product [Clonostachys rosea f. rosea IK726]|uniref:Uncharacterized protein n=1 Tax=Clonostachys rosea f. rosea IK726 TaxID=1349383 RepID=A0ACA9U4W9_BIOOC|nr:unnamed protein product [Clonostachys rosea f. rosea IK726]